MSWQRNTNPNQIAKRTDIDGEVFEIIGDRAANLAWDQLQGGLHVIPGGSNYYNSLRFQRFNPQALE
jgi:hypothetical protein